MKYDDIRKEEIRALRCIALRKWTVWWRVLYCGAVAALIGVAVADVIGRILGWPGYLNFVLAGFVILGLSLVFQPVMLEPTIRKEVENLKND